MTPEEKKAAKRVYQKNYRAEHPEWVKASNKKYYAEHSEKEKTRNRQYRAEHPVEVKACKRRYRLKRNFGLTPTDYDQMEREQNGCCKICGKQVKLHVDHDHVTGTVRGLLCHQCNTVLGLVGESRMTLRKMATYLQATT